MTGRNSIFTTVLERERKRWREREREGRWRRWRWHPSNSAQDRQTYRVLSMYSVHRINPQCVLTNITQLPPDRFASVGEARSAKPPASAIPAHRH